MDTAPVEPGAVGGAKVFDVPETVRDLEAGVLVGGEIVGHGQGALAARDEVGVEGMALVSGLDEQRLGGRDGCDISEGDAGLAGHGGYGGLPRLLLLLGGVFPGREGSGPDATVGFVGSPREVFEADAGHATMMPESWPSPAARPAPPGRAGPDRRSRRWR